MAGSIREKLPPVNHNPIDPSPTFPAPDKTISPPSETELSITSAPQGEARMTRAKWLACIALGLGYTTCFQQHVCTATILRWIDKDLGPTDQYNWMLTGYTIGSAVALPLTGGLSDIFGRRYFFIGGCVVSLVGTVITATATSVEGVIPGMVLKGVGGAAQQLALAGVGELVPNKHRGTAQAWLDILVTPWTVFGALTGGAMVHNHHLGFRINWYLGIGLNLLTILTTYLWYHPPSSPSSHGIIGATKWEQLKQLDWVGIFLLGAGLSISLMGLGFGGITYPWKHAGVLAPIVIGVLLLVALGFYEWKIAKHPFLAPQLFRQGRSFTMVLFIAFVAGMGLYAASAFWTQQVFHMWSENPIRIGVLTIPGGFGGAAGGFVAGMIIGKHPLLKTNLMLLYGAAIKVIADATMTTLTPDTIPRALGLAFFSMVGTGWLLVTLIVCIQLTCDDKNIGLATMLLGCIRSIGGAVAVTVYSTILGNTVRPNVVKDILSALKPISQIPQVYEVGGAVYQALERAEGSYERFGFQTEVLRPLRNPVVWELAYTQVRWTWAKAFKNLFICATAFAAVALVATFFVKDMSKNMTENVAVRLKNEAPVGGKDSDEEKAIKAQAAAAEEAE